MPRLTTHLYLDRHHELRAQFLDSKNNHFLLLRPNEQWDLFSYFLPHEEVDDARLLEYRIAMSALDPSLPQRAGRAYKTLTRLSEYFPAWVDEMKSRPKPKRNTNKNFFVLSEVHPELDPEELAKILWIDVKERLCKDRIERELHP